jgi:P27 family predicted phage terminase small subunit
VLRAADRGVLAVWCEAEEHHRVATEAQARLDAGSSLPLLAKGKEGQPVPSPYLRIINHAALLMLRAASELGFSPAARPRLAAGGDAGGAGEDGASAWGELEVIRGGRA